LAVYRIVQEALTNVVRHAAPARCRVSVEASAGEVRVEVADDGPGERMLPGGRGHGLVGMRERVAVYGGSLTAGRRPEGGFGISARMPYGEAP
ncbi:ATP-binding protein, partial [Streptosporangium amethystogenes]|uniref:ATP-binding protein n=1 Tax=Streptosporangium amethystogenes TaxID=2002 RepID=UPI0031DDAB4A